MLGFGVSGFGFRVSGSGFRVSGSGHKKLEGLIGNTGFGAEGAERVEAPARPKSRMAVCPKP